LGEQEKKTDIKQNTADKMRALFTSKDEQKRRKEEQSLQTKQSHSVDESRMQQSLSKMRTLFLIPEVRDQYLQEFAKRKQ
jgi:hypothetical protein